MTVDYESQIFVSEDGMIINITLIINKIYLNNLLVVEDSMVRALLANDERAL